MAATYNRPVLPTSRLAILVAAGVFLLSLATLSGHLYSVDGLAYYRSATTLAWQGSLLLDPPLVWGSVARAVPWPVGYPLVLFPLAAVLSPLQDLQPVFDLGIAMDMRLLYADPVYALMSWVNGLIVALTAAATLLLAREIGLSPRIALASSLAAGLASPLFFYGHADFAQPLTTLLLVVGILLALRSRRASSTREKAMFVPVAALAVLARPVDGVFSLLIWLAIIVWPSTGGSLAVQRIKAAALAIGGLALGLAVSFFVNKVRRGDPLDFGYNIEGPIDAIATTLAYLVSPGRGIPWHFPLAVLAPFGVLALLRVRRIPETVALVLPIALWVGAYAVWTSLGNVSYGPRFLLPIFPLLAILAGASLMLGQRHVRWIFAALASIGVAANVSLLAADQLRYWINRGDNQVNTTGYWRQFEPGAYAPLGSLRVYDPTGLSDAADIIWLRLAPETSGLSLLVMLVAAAGGLALLVMAARRARG